MDDMAGYAWPGNIREFEQVLERAVILGSRGALSVPAIREAIAQTSAGPVSEATRAEAHAAGAGMLTSLLVDQLPPLAVIEAAYCEYVLRRTDGVKGRAAHVLQIDPGTLARKRKALDEVTTR